MRWERADTRPAPTRRSKIMNKVTVTKLPKSKVEMLVEIPAEDFSVFIDKALTEIAKEFQASGFRKGAAPKEIVKKMVGQIKIMDRAAGMAIEATIGTAVTENHLEPLGYPEVHILKLAEGNPFEYKAVIAVYPQITLPNYKQIAGGFKLEEVKVTEEEIKRLKMEKERHALEHLREDALAAVAQKTAIEVPEILVERETEKMMGQLKEKTPRALNMSFEEYLGKLGKTEAELRETMAKDNEGKIKNYMVLQEISKLENITVSDEEIIAAAKKEIGEDAAPDEQMKEYYRENLKAEKTFEFLEGFFKKS